MFIRTVLTLILIGGVTCAQAQTTRQDSTFVEDDWSFDDQEDTLQQMDTPEMTTPVERDDEYSNRTTVMPDSNRTDPERVTMEPAPAPERRRAPFRIVDTPTPATPTP